MQIGGVDFTAPNVDHVKIQFVARVLSKIPRFGGDIDWPYPVAAHCITLSHMVKEPDAQKGALMHDTSESLIGDMPRPWKRWLGNSVYQLESTLDQLFSAHFNYSTKFPEIWRWDDEILYVEQKLLGAFTLPEFQAPATASEDEKNQATRLIMRLLNRSAKQIEDEFVERFMELDGLSTKDAGR